MESHWWVWEHSISQHMVVYTSNPNPLEKEEGGSRVQGHSLHRELETGWS